MCHTGFGQCADPRGAYADHLRWADLSIPSFASLSRVLPPSKPARAARMASRLGGREAPAHVSLCARGVLARVSAICGARLILTSGRTERRTEQRNAGLCRMPDGCPHLWVPSNCDLNKRERPPPGQSGGGRCCSRECRDRRALYYPAGTGTPEAPHDRPRGLPPSPLRGAPATGNLSDKSKRQPRKR